MGSCLSVQTPRQTPSRHRDRPRTVDKIEFKDRWPTTLFHILYSVKLVVRPIGIRKNFT